MDIKLIQSDPSIMMGKPALRVRAPRLNYFWKNSLRVKLLSNFLKHILVDNQGRQISSSTSYFSLALISYIQVDSVS